ncbi:MULTISPECIES: fatty acid biosynthesis transcriptional regulator FabT [Streptococcus]|uniref:MarR family winged helix-turn-helix transcriptional regulator n=1 Tax=Streptococcus caledonicus TaxID=2614158 RepID=A0ABW0UD85_9STRE|nr:MarR family transcriptional regulator [Streptococcus sp. S784/96/1]
MDFHQINDYLVDIFNRILVIEENTLRSSPFSDCTIKEVHTIDIIGKNRLVTPSDIAKELMVTLGTVTTALNKLESKGYVIRTRSQEDRRVVYLSLTKKGRVVYHLHKKFHRVMIDQILAGMSENELEGLERGLVNLHTFLEERR